MFRECQINTTQALGQLTLALEVAKQAESEANATKLSVVQPAGWSLAYWFFVRWGEAISPPERKGRDSR